MVFTSGQHCALLTIHRRVKILREAGLEEADVVVPYDSCHGNISKVKGYTFNLLDNGEINFFKKTYTLKNIMPLVEEPYVTTFSDYEASIRFILTGFQPQEGRYRALLPTWKKLAEQMMEDEDFGQMIEKKKIYKNWLSDNNIDLSGKKDMAHAIAIYQTVQHYFEWDESYWT